MKKINIMYIIIIMLIFCATSIYAESNDLYSIELADGFTEITKNYFSDNDGNTINIIINELSSTEGFEYTDENLEIIISEANNANIESSKEELKQQMKETFGDSFSDEYIEQYVESIKINGVLKKKIKEIGKSKYECFYYRTKWSVGEDYSYLADTYMVISAKKSYTITVSGTETFLESENINNMLDTFTIVNFKPIEKESFGKNILAAGFSGMLETLILVGMFGAFGAIFGRKKKSKENVSSKGTTQNTSDKIGQINDGNISENNDVSVKNSLSFENEKTVFKQSNLTYSDDFKLIKDENESGIDNGKIIPNDTPRYCNECGEKLEQDWLFCNNCGSKIIK